MKKNKIRKTPDAWADREIKLACEAAGTDNYTIKCCESAKKAYDTLMEDPHSGLSIGMTRHILDRLIEGKPLTSIKDIPDVWTEMNFGEDEPAEDSTVYICNRMPSLSKHVKDDGTITYSDHRRFMCHSINNPDVVYTFGFVTDVLDKVYPITMPYYPSLRGFEVTCQDGLSNINKANTDFDTFAIISVTRPNGEVDEINRYFKEAEYSSWVEIDKDEFIDRISSRDGNVI